MKRNPERSEGSLGACAPREDRDVLSPRPPFVFPSLFLSPRGVSRGVPNAPFCHPETQAEGSPIVKEEISRFARNDKVRLRSK
jgi:hypothetical protein